MSGFNHPDRRPDTPAADQRHPNLSGTQIGAETHRGIVNTVEGLQTPRSVDIVRLMAVTLRLSEEEQDALRQRAELEGVSVHETARRAVREYIATADHRDRVAAASEVIMRNHAAASRRLGE